MNQNKFRDRFIECMVMAVFDCELSEDLKEGLFTVDEVIKCVSTYGKECKDLNELGEEFNAKAGIDGDGDGFDAYRFIRWDIAGYVFGEFQSLILVHLLKPKVPALYELGKEEYSLKHVVCHWKGKGFIWLNDNLSPNNTVIEAILDLMETNKNVGVFVSTEWDEKYLGDMGGYFADCEGVVPPISMEGEE